MLKPSQRANAPRTGGRGTGVIRLFKVLAVQPNGLVVEFKDQRGTERGFMEATPQFVEQKNKSPNFMAKAEGSTMHAKFYAALMRPTSNAEHQYRTNADILSAKVYPRNGSQTVEGFGELQKVAVGGGFTVFARAESQKKDPLRLLATKQLPASRASSTTRRRSIVWTPRRRVRPGWNSWSPRVRLKT